MKNTQKYIDNAINFATEQAAEGYAKYWFTIEVLKEIKECLDKDISELPSDEEIERTAESLIPQIEHFGIDFAENVRVFFVEGAKWMRNKI